MERVGCICLLPVEGLGKLLTSFSGGLGYLCHSNNKLELCSHKYHFWYRDFYPHSIKRLHFSFNIRDYRSITNYETQQATP
jgi:hypothetical protein